MIEAILSNLAYLWIGFLELMEDVDFGFSGDDDFCPGRKRTRISAPFVFGGERFEQKRQASIEVLPDECLFEIFRRLPGGEERSACACVSKRWLSLLSNMSRDELCDKKTTQLLNESVEKNGEVKSRAENQEIEGGGCLSRCLEGKKATDIRLSAIAVGTASRGGLGKLSICGNNSYHGVTSAGLRAIARGCPSLKALTLWKLPLVGDEGLYEIANGCHMLEKLDLCGCPAISDKGLLAIARNCPNLTDLTIEACSGIGNEGLQAVGRYCTNLKSISIKNCPVVGDQGISGLVSSATYGLSKMKLQALNVTDVSLAVIGHYGKAVTDLVLTNLPNVSEKGFWVMGNGHGLQKLKSFTVTSCRGLTDTGLEAMGKGCPNLKQFCLRKCAFLTDNGLVLFVRAAKSLESLQLEECHRITQLGCFGSLLNCGFGDGSLALMGKFCPQLQYVELSGLKGVTDAGFTPLLENYDAGLVKVNLSGCVNVSDKVVSALTEQHGWTLEVLNLDGCVKITDASLAAIAENCLLLSELYVSRCAISDSGLMVMACSNQLNLQIFSVSGCSMISDQSLTALVKMGQTLLGLNLQHCNAISTSTVDLLVERLWRCDILS
ncbi:hypothetical protein GH714_043373 [Hevea brasiliensis]|uniref:F-box domain-containing protein n=1 Tax=Hevea brasiliensis TaxID=3981 RepID=A0A6A6K3D4_HEVBR|nr:hypothetical protein GH714_043373 [Hevea brasiliensis]